jgi:hypothetical protein
MKKIKKPRKNYAVKSKMFFILTIAIFAVSTIIYFLNDKSRNTNEVSRKSIEALKRAKEMLADLPENDDIYGLKQVFNTAEIVPISYKGKELQATLSPGKNYCIVFFLPESQEDYEKSGGPKDVIMYTATDANKLSSIPVYVVINPVKMQKFKNNGVFLDYLASSMLHETVHVYQRSLLLRNGQKVSISVDAIEQREKEAYSFQAKFINQILVRNKIDTKIAVPILDIRGINKKGLSNLCEEVDRINGYKLGPVASLVVFNAYPDTYISIANILHSE